jgi:hypothetical protein
MQKTPLSQDSNILRKHVIDGEGRHGVGFILEHVLSYDAEIHQMKERGHHGLTFSRGIAHVFSQGEAYEHHQYDPLDPASTPAVRVEQRPQSVCHSAQ